MADQKFDFESFNTQYNSAVTGLQDTIAAVKNVIPQVEEVAQQTGSAKLTRTTMSFVQVAQEQIDCFTSIEESADEVKTKYGKIDAAMN